MKEMPRKLTDSKIKTAKSGNKSIKLFDGGGLYVLFTKNGSKLRRYKYRINNKEGVYAIGSYPDISLKAARDEHEKARVQVAKGQLPIKIKQERKIETEHKEHDFDYYKNR